MRLVHSVARLARGMGGPAASVPALCRALAAASHEVTLVTGAGEVADAVASLEPEVTVRLAPLGPYAIANFSFAFRSALRDAMRSADLLHTHGIWLDPNWASAREARRHRVPFVVSPRGMLSPQALARSRWRKRLAWSLLDGPHCRAADLIHATSGEEARQVRAAGIAAPIAVIPNGVDTEAFAPMADPARLGSGQRRSDVVFLSRVHPIKGLDRLLDAWRRVRRRGSEFDDLILAGPGESGHLEWLRGELAGMVGLGVRYVGPVWGDEKLRLLRNARAVVLPSYSESYGMVVAEALACGTPVIATEGTPWSDLTTERCGWSGASTSEALAVALEEALTASFEELDEMGRRGRAWVEREHSLHAGAERMVEAYQWVLARGSRPAWVLDRNEAA